MEAAAPPPNVPPPPLDEDRPATVGDLRALRRWVAVAGIWAVAATVVGVIALIDSNDKSDQDRVGTLASDLARVERDLNHRIDGLERRIGDLPKTGDLQKLERRVAKVEDGTSATRSDLKKLETRVKDLDTRVSKVERSSSTGGGTTTTPKSGATSP